MGRTLAAIAVAVALAACAASPTSTALKIRTQPAVSGCLFGRLPVPRVTLSIDASKSDQIWAIADDGTRFPIEWPNGSRITDSGEPVVVDVSGQVAGANGDVIVRPDNGFPTLRGRSVCFGSGMLSVMATDVQAAPSTS